MSGTKPADTNPGSPAPTSIGRRLYGTFRLILILGLIFLALSPVLSQPTARPRLLRVGYLARETSGHPSGGALEGMRDALWKNDVVRAELEREGFTGIGLFACDGYSDMARRLNQREFHVAFTPATLYARQTVGYTAVLKSRRKEDSFSPNGRVWRQGVIFVSSRSPLHGTKEITAESLADYLSRERLAVAGTQSVAGFEAPLLRLAEDYNIRGAEGGYLWFESSEEVAKGVLSGVADIGACEEQALDRLLEQEGLKDKRDQLIRVILRSDRIPTDPVVLLPSLEPRASALGRELRRAIREFSLRGGLGELQYATATDLDYGAVTQLLDEFSRRVGEVPF